MENVRRIIDIPESDTDEVVSDFESEGAKVSKTKQADGNWTVTATFRQRDGIFRCGRFQRRSLERFDDAGDR